MSKNLRLRKCIVAVLLAFTMVASLLAAGIGNSATVDAATTGTTTFVYAGEGSYSASEIGFWATGICVNGNWPSVDCNVNALDSSYTVTTETTTVDGRPAVVFSADTSVCTELWVNLWVGSVSKNGNQIKFDGTVYYIYDDNTVTTDAPSDNEEGGEVEVPEATEYTVNVHVYGQDASVNCWLIQTSGGTEVAWGTSESGSGTLSGDWSDITFNFSSTVAYDRVGVWLDTNYKLDLNGNTCDMWIVPEAGTCYDNEADALAAAAEPATSSTIIFHYKKTSGTMGGWVVGTWYTSAINGGWGSKDTVFTYEDDWGYVAVVKYSAVLNEIGFKFHRRAKIDGVANDWYKEDGKDRTVTLSNGFAEVWITQGKKAVSYTCPEGATEFDASTATKFKNYRYLLIETAKGEKADLVFHYLREDGNYDDWSVGIWAEVTSGAWKDAQITQNAELDEYGAATYTVDLSEWPKTEIGFAVNYNNWEKKDYDADRYVDVSGVEAGEVLNVYLYEGDGNIYYAPKTDAIVEEETAGLDADVVFHYSRTNADYEGWMVGLWCELADGSWLNDNVAFDGTDADGLATVTVDLSKFQSAALGFKLNKDNWASEDGGDRSLDLTNINDGDIIDIYLYEGDDTVYFEPKAEEEPVVEEVVVSETDVVEETPADDTADDTADDSKGGCAGCTGCTGCAVMLPIFAAIIAGALIIFKKRA